MSEEELININGIREDLYQAMQIGDITLSSKHSQELYDFMNYQDKEIERLERKNDNLKETLKLYKEGKKWYDFSASMTSTQIKELRDWFRDREIEVR